MKFKNEARDYGVRRDESWISLSIVSVSSCSLPTKYYLGYQIGGWAWHVTGVGETGDTGRVLVEKFEGKVTF